jgi:hypothetical protein
MSAWIGFITRFATAIGGGAGGSKEKRRSVLRTAAVIFTLVREFKADSIARIEEAVVQEVESEAREARADAERRVAEAAEIQARTALTLAKAEQVKAEAATRLWKAETERIEAQANAKAKQIKAISDASAKLIEATAKLKRAGGSVAFDECELRKLILLGIREFPDDPITTDGASDIELADPQKGTE